MSHQLESSTRHRPSRRVRRRVKVADRVAETLIIVGGVTTLGAVLAVAFFLLWVTLPVFLPAQTSEPTRVRFEAPMDPLHLGVDEYQQLGWWLLPSGELEVFRLDNGEIRQRLRLFAEGELRSTSFHPSQSLAVFGLANGTVQTGQIELVGEVRRLEDLDPATRRRLETATDTAAISTGQGLLQRTPSGHLRLLELRARLAPPILVGDSPIRLVRHVMTAQGPWIVALTEEEPTPRLFAIRGEQRADFLTGQSTVAFQEPIQLPYQPMTRDAPRFLEILATGSDIFVAWESGELLRLHLPATGDAFVAEQGRLVAAGRQLTSMGHLLGQKTLVWGDSDGAVRGGFLVHVDEYQAAVRAGRAPATAAISTLRRDPRATHFLALTKKLAAEGGAAASALAPSARSRLLISGFGNGEVRLSNLTNEARLASLRLQPGAAVSPDPKAVTRLIMAPKEDGFLALAGRRLYHATFDPGHPEVSLRGLLTPVWYEGYSEPRHIWQSSGGTDDFEPKLGLYPLLFGTLKATFYAMLVAAPLAILAALFTSEFLTRRAREVVKPTLELMASVPGVVLGFLAALVLAPFVEGRLPVLLTFLLTLPLSWLAGALLWRRLPADSLPRGQRGRLVGIALALPLSFLLAMGLAPILEGALFGGDLKAWLASNLTGYSQHNALIVGFAMGFTVIPVIFTLAEDALSAVPDHLRIASLAAGATPWQTALRIVLPSASSGLVSALMVGLGRAVGETMIVLMAAGNTPVLEWNLFAGFRTLSASLAVELPEAVQGSSHYRTLFLAALALFVLTFLVNTLAEVIRLRFRRRAFQL